MGMTKTQFIIGIVDVTGVSKQDVASVLAELAELVKAELAATGKVTIPGVVTLTTKVRPSTETRLGVNPFTKQEQVFHGKPTSLAVKARVVKNIKDAVR